MGSAGRDVLAADTTGTAEAKPPRATATLPDPVIDEAEDRRRARQLALILMAASGVVTIGILASLWLLFGGAL